MQRASRLAWDGLLVAFLLFLGLDATSHAADTPCSRCGWKPPRIAQKLLVSSIAQLEQALEQAQPNSTILLQPGKYSLRRPLLVDVPGLTLRSASGDRASVIITGSGAVEKQIGVALRVDARGVTLADFTIGNVGFHGVQLRENHLADDLTLHNLRVLDTGQQLLKGSCDQAQRGSDRGQVLCCLFEYTDHAPSDYTNGVDVLGGSGWVVRSNVFRRVRGRPDEGYVCGPTILFWRGCQDTLVEGNLLIDCYRGIALGLTNQPGTPDPNSQSPYADHTRGIIRRNVIVNQNAWPDESLEVNACPDALIEHNSVLVPRAKSPWSIGVRFPNSSAIVRNNLTSLTILTRDGGQITENQGNITSAQADWFIDPAKGDLRLARPGLPAIDAGMPTAQNRPLQVGSLPDAGAFEFQPQSSTRPE